MERIARVLVNRWRSRAWMPRERWDALVRGEDCPMCASYAEAPAEDRYGFTVADLGISRLRLARNQYVRGYCVLICARHGPELYHLSVEDQAQYSRDLIRAASALNRVFKPDRMNYEMLGNAIPHIHCHLKPRYYGDPAPSRPIFQDERFVELSSEKYQRLIEEIRTAL